MMFAPLEINNVIDEEYQDKLYNLVTDIEFPWHFMEDTTNEKLTTNNLPTPAFGHLIFHPNHSQNPYAEIFTPLVNAIVEQANMELAIVHRIRLGFLLNTKYTYAGSPYQYNTVHRDMETPHWTAVYYFNDCDGNTVIFRETHPAEKYYPLHKSEPKKGKVVVFDGMHYHASTCPKVYNKRIACTINFSAKVK
jgi:hypothetical protein